MAMTKAVTDDFWKQPEAAITDVQVKAIYEMVKTEMQTELAQRNANIIDTMLAERTAFLYAHIRNREAATTSSGQAAFANDRARKETLQLWAQMSENLQKRWSKEDDSTLEHTLKKRLAGAVDTALLDIDPAVAVRFRKALVEVMQDSGL